MQKRNYRSLLLGLGIALSSTLIAVILFEGALRVFWHNPYRFEKRERVLRLPIQHARTDHIVDRSLIDPEHRTVRFRTDESSYVLPSRRYDTPDATIAFLGGSTTECMAVQEELRFPARVSYLLEKKGLKINTLNAAKSGNTTQDSINVLINHVVEEKPDVIVLMEAANDIGVLAAAKSYRPRMDNPDGISQIFRFALQEASSNFYTLGMVRQWVTYGRPRPRANLVGREAIEKEQLPRDEYEKRLRAFIGISRGFGIEPVLMTQPVANIRSALTPDFIDSLNQEMFNYTIRKVGAEESVVVIDLVRYLIENVEGWSEPMKIFYDGMHVNDRGSEVYAGYIADRLYGEVLVHRISAAVGRRSPTN